MSDSQAQAAAIGGGLGGAAIGGWLGGAAIGGWLGGDNLAGVCVLVLVLVLVLIATANGVAAAGAKSYGPTRTAQLSAKHIRPMDSQGLLLCCERSGRREAHRRSWEALGEFVAIENLAPHSFPMRSAFASQSCRIRFALIRCSFPCAPQSLGIRFMCVALCRMGGDYSCGWMTTYLNFLAIANAMKKVSCG